MCFLGLKSIWICGAFTQKLLRLNKELIGGISYLFCGKSNSEHKRVKVMWLFKDKKTGTGYRFMCMCKITVSINFDKKWM